MLVADVISRVRTTSGDLDVLQFTDEQLVSWVNDGIRECALENNLLQKRASLLTSTNEDYSLPEDILKIHSIFLDNKALTLTSMEDAGNAEGTTGHVWANRLIIRPTPEIGLVLEINYIYSPRTVSGSSEIPLPVGYHSRIVDYCLAQVAQLDDDMNRYQLKMEEFRTGVQNLKFNERSEENYYPSISVLDGDYGYGEVY